MISTNHSVRYWPPRAQRIDFDSDAGRLRRRQPRISVVVPVHNGGDDLHECVEALLAAMGPRDELIVVADGESDGAWRQLPDRVRVLVNSETRGPAAARNRGARAATNELIFFVDADVLVPTDALARIREVFAGEPDVHALFGSYDDTPGHPAFLSQYRNLLHHHTHQTGSEHAITFWGACGAIRRSVFEAVGGFDEGYRHPSIEDIEIGYRLSAAGYNIRLLKDLQVKHLKSWSARSITQTDLLRRAIPWTQLLLERRKMDNDLNVSVNARLSVAATWGIPFAALAGFWIPGPALFACVALIASVIALNAPFYRFLWRQRGVAFTLLALPWHAFYFAYSGLGFVFGAAQFAAARFRKGVSTSQPPTISNSSPCTIPPLSSSAPVRQD
jgi:GT2 family glycosyltransferase